MDEWMDNEVAPMTYKVTGGTCWRTNGSSLDGSDNIQGVLFLEGLPVMAPGSGVFDIETGLSINVVRQEENGALCVTPIYRSPLRWWQRLACRLFRLQDARDRPPCVNRGSRVIMLPESHYEGGEIPYPFCETPEYKGSAE